MTTVLMMGMLSQVSSIQSLLLVLDQKDPNTVNLLGRVWQEAAEYACPQERSTQEQQQCLAAVKRLEAILADIMGWQTGVWQGKALTLGGCTDAPDDGRHEVGTNLHGSALTLWCPILTPDHPPS